MGTSSSKQNDNGLLLSYGRYKYLGTKMKKTGNSSMYKIFDVYKYIKKEGDESILFNSNTKFDEDKHSTIYDKNDCSKINDTYKDNYKGKEELYNIFNKKCDTYDFFLRTLKDAECDNIYEKYTHLVSKKIFHENKGTLTHNTKDEHELYENYNGTFIYDIENANELYKKGRKINCDMRKFDNYVKRQSEVKDIFYLTSVEMHYGGLTC